MCSWFRFCFGVFHFSSVCYAWWIHWLLASEGEKETEWKRGSEISMVLGVCLCYCCWLILCLYFVSFIISFRCFFPGCCCLPPISKMLLVFFLCFCKQLCVECIAHTSSMAHAQFVLWTPFKCFLFFNNSLLFTLYLPFILLPAFRFFVVVVFSTFISIFAEFVCFLLPILYLFFLVLLAICFAFYSVQMEMISFLLHAFSLSSTLSRFLSIPRDFRMKHRKT